MSSLLKRKSVIKVKDFFDKKNLSINLIVLDETARTAEDAAKSLNKSVGAIIKSLLFKSDNNIYYLCLVSGDKYLSLEKLSKITDAKVIKANADECKQVTGFSIGGVAPVGHIIPPTNIYIDENLRKFDIIYAAAGHPYVVFGITFENLCLITKGMVSDIVK